jgi:hypothetical protein
MLVSGSISYRIVHRLVSLRGLRRFGVNAAHRFKMAYPLHGRGYVAR